MVNNFDYEIGDQMEISKEAIEIAKEILAGNTILTPKKVAKFILLSGYPEIVDVFIHINGEEENPFSDEDEYEENIFYFESSTDDVYRITYDELKRITMIFIQQEIERSLFINEDEKEYFMRIIQQE